MPKIIHILSVGHSGSTIFDIMLGQFSNVFSTGELKHLLWQYHRELTNDNTKQRCTCGVDFSVCSIWGKVFDEMAMQLNVSKQELPSVAPIKHFDSLSYFSKPLYDKILRNIYKHNLSLKIIPAVFFRCLFSKVNRANQKLYDAIYEGTKKEYIVDSSKDIIRCNEMRKQYNVFPIVFVRNFNDILKSQYVNPKNDKQFIQNWREYYNKHVYSFIKNLRTDQYAIIGYEKFVSDPYGTFKSLSEKIDINLAEFTEQANMKEMHIVAGNPMRFGSDVQLRKADLDKERYNHFLNQSGLKDIFVAQLSK